MDGSHPIICLDNTGAKLALDVNAVSTLPGRSREKSRSTKPRRKSTGVQLSKADYFLLCPCFMPASDGCHLQICCTLQGSDGRDLPAIGVVPEIEQPCLDRWVFMFQFPAVCDDPHFHILKLRIDIRFYSEVNRVSAINDQIFES